MDQKYYSIMMLHALGDTLGFKNGEWEMYYKENLEVLDYVNELIYEFIDLGGINGINLKGWKVSDDTFLHIAIAKSMLRYKGGITDKLIIHIKSNLYYEAQKMWDEKYGKKMGKFDRYIGVTTSNSIKQFTDNFDARFDKYDHYAGGNGAAMRNLVIGMCLFGNKNRNKLIDLSVISSQLTHNNSIGYLAGFTSALFVALALENVPIKKWPFKLIEYLNSDKLKSFLSLENLDQVYDHNTYIRYWYKYIDTKFDRNGKPLKIRANSNPMHRIRYYYENFIKDTAEQQIGSSGYSCMIMAYDALLDCDGIWEKLIVYAMLHSGDSDTIGAIAGGLYGAVYGMGDVPLQMINYLERKKELENLSSELYDKFNK